MIFPPPGASIYMQSPGDSPNITSATITTKAALGIAANRTLAVLLSNVVAYPVLGYNNI